MSKIWLRLRPIKLQSFILPAVSSEDQQGQAGMSAGSEARGPGETERIAGGVSSQGGRRTHVRDVHQVGPVQDQGDDDDDDGDGDGDGDDDDDNDGDGDDDGDDGDDNDDGDMSQDLLWKISQLSDVYSERKETFEKETTDSKALKVEMEIDDDNNYY